MSWQEELRNGIRTAEQLAPILGWSPEETAQRVFRHQRRSIQHKAGGFAAQICADRSAAQLKPVRYVLPPLFPEADGGTDRR